MQRRGGVAAGETSNNPTATSYANSPPSSTYPSRLPQIGGSSIGFFSLVFGLGFVLLLIGGGYLFLRRRRKGNRQRSRARFMATRGNRGMSAPRRTGGGGEAGEEEEEGEEEWEAGNEEDDDAFELPATNQSNYDLTLTSASSSTTPRRQPLDPSQLSLDLKDHDRRSYQEGYNHNRSEDSLDEAREGDGVDKEKLDS